MTGQYYETGQDGELLCRLCPNACRIADGEFGVCRVRGNRAGVLDLPFYGCLSSAAVDPIEKKPLYHFYPGQNILSIGFVGCSFRCPFCQNHRISQETDIPTDRISPAALADLAEKQGSFGVAYTYSEPLIHIEYVLDCARKVRERGLKNVLVSNGYINPEPADELLNWIDAANIDLKSFDAGFYRQEIGGRLEPVKAFIARAAKKIHLEVTTLVIPTKNDTPEEIGEIAAFLGGLDADIPYHLSAYTPQYRYTLPPTPSAVLERLATEAKNHLHYVYLGNVGLTETNTHCRGCGNLLVQRSGYRVNLTGLTKDCCSKCGRTSPVHL